MKYERVLAEIYRKPWAILPEKFAQICEIVSLRASGEKLTEKEIRARLAPHLKARANGGGVGNFGVVAVIPIYGVIQQRMNLMSQISGGTSIEKLTGQFRAALADPSIKSVVFDVDSPGGGVEGVQELAEEIYRSRGKKKVTAVANSLAASAAYWLACQADEIVVTPSGQVGSVGIFTAHEDLSAAMEKMGVKVSLISAGKFKTEGNPYEPLSDEARAALQEKVNSVYDVFIKQVAKGRGVSQAAVREGFGQGRLLLAQDAVKERMADRVATLDETIGKMGGGAAPKRMAASPAAQLAADTSDPDQGGDLERECECLCSGCTLEGCEACVASECSDEACKADGCPMQEKAQARAALDLRRRELNLLARNL